METSAWRKRSHFEVCVYFDVLEICLCVIFGSGGVGFLTYDGPATLAVGKPDRTVNHCLATGLQIATSPGETPSFGFHRHAHGWQGILSWIAGQSAQGPRLVRTKLAEET